MFVLFPLFSLALRLRNKQHGSTRGPANDTNNAWPDLNLPTLILQLDPAAHCTVSPHSPHPANCCRPLLIHNLSNNYKQPPNGFSKFSPFASSTAAAAAAAVTVETTEAFTLVEECPARLALPSWLSHRRPVCSRMAERVKRCGGSHQLRSQLPSSPLFSLCTSRASRPT